MTPELNNTEESDFNHSSKYSNGAPHLDTLNLTRNSLHFAEINLPRTPSPVYVTGSSTGPLQITRAYAEVDEYYGNGRVADIESAIPRTESVGNVWDAGGESFAEAAKQLTFRSRLESAC